jgi:hypothetical protein
MTEIEIGGRFANDKLAMFGLEEVNSLIAAGHRVTGMRGKGAVVTSFNNPQSGEKMWALSGFAIVVTFASPNANDA